MTSSRFFHRTATERAANQLISGPERQRKETSIDFQEQFGFQKLIRLSSEERLTVAGSLPQLLECSTSMTGVIDDRAVTFQVILP
jgi:hypothetical protein